jgi:putative ABC transport system permease protein
MSVLMVFRVALKALGRNKMRTALTMLGMIIGVAAVITMVALGTGAQTSIEAQIQSTGTNMIIVSAGNFSQGGVRQGQGNASTLNPDDAAAISRVDGVQYTAPGINTRGQLIFGNQNWNTQVQGTDVDFPLIRSWPTAMGIFFTPQDVSTAAKVAVLGNTVRDQLFGPGADPTGQVIRIANTSAQGQTSYPFTVVGVLSSKGQSGVGQDQDDVVFVPYTTVMKKMRGVTFIQHTTVMKKMRGVTFIQQVTVSATAANDTSATADRIAALLRVRHKIQPGDPDDFMVRTMEEMAAVRVEATQTMTALLASIAGVSLLVGGIGIMNIMLVSVTERTREIGLRMAIGARGRDVLLQFLVEAVVLSLFGGAVGIALGFGLSQGVTLWMNWPTAVSPGAVAVSFGFAGAIGVFFGFYPARKAAALDPIDALRFE